MINLVECFYSIQGEGYNFGMECVFVRVSDCNLNCPWCDTDWKKANFSYNSFDEFYNANIDETNQIRNVIITGGEPTKHQEQFDCLVNGFINKGWKVHVETNGLNEIDRNDIWISTSPKIIFSALYKKKMIKRANEVRVVIDPKIDIPKQIEALRYFKNNIKADRYYLSPCEVEGKFNFDLLAIIYDVVKEEGWNISIQLHKLMKVR